jgi:hypothetical protein
VRKCAFCNKEFLPRGRNVRFCCGECHVRWHVAERKVAVAFWRQMQEEQSVAEDVVEENAA